MSSENAAYSSAASGETSTAQRGTSPLLIGGLALGLAGLAGVGYLAVRRRGALTMSRAVAGGGASGGSPE